MSPIVIASGGWEARIRPDIGGALATLSKDGRQMLRPMPDIASDVRDSACFAMLPFSNRIAGAQFEWDGRTVSLEPDMLAYPHALNGTGWQVPWEVEVATTDTAILCHHHERDTQGWPWAFRAQLQYSVSGEGLAVLLSMTNLSSSPMPAGLGLHPYLRRSSQTSVRFEAEEMVLTDADGMPTGESASPGRFAQWAQGAELPNVLVDHCHTGWTGTAEVSDHFGTVTLQAEGAPHLHIYAPPESGVLCCEPVSHRPNALNQFAQDVIVLKPGETQSLTLRIGHR